VKCPLCREHKVVVLPKASSKEFFYLECPNSDCWAVLVQVVVPPRRGVR
jgi:hypothetical protein